MKSTYVLAVAATLDQATATLGEVEALAGLVGNVLGAAGNALVAGSGLATWPSVSNFNTPDEPCSYCTEEQNSGFNFSAAAGLTLGSLPEFGGITFNGWVVANAALPASRRDMLAGRSAADDNDFVITANVNFNGTDNPVMKAGDKIANSFDLDSIFIKPEEKIRLDFIYTLSDNSTCKQTSDVTPEGTLIVNTQCGGASALEIAASKDQGSNDLEKRTFGRRGCVPIRCPRVKYRCNKKPKPVYPVYTKTKTPVYPVYTKTKTPVKSKTTPVKSKTTPVNSQTTPTPSTVIITNESTSTVYTTYTSTITSCGPSVTDCPITTAGQTATVTVTVSVSTTLIPGSKTETVTVTQPTAPNDNDKTTTTTATQTSCAPDTTDTNCPPKPDKQPETPVVFKDFDLCGEVVPRCLKTWYKIVPGAQNNIDIATLCPDPELAKVVNECLYAHAGEDAKVAEAIGCFRGVCAPYIPKNPQITDAGDNIASKVGITSLPPPPSVTSTTIFVTNTVTEGSTTSVSSSSVIAPVVTYIPSPTPSVTETNTVPSPTDNVVPPTKGVVSPTKGVSKPSGTGVLPTGTQLPTVVAAAGKVQASVLGLVAFVLAVAL